MGKKRGREREDSTKTKTTTTTTTRCSFLSLSHTLSRVPFFFPRIHSPRVDPARGMRERISRPKDARKTKQTLSLFALSLEKKKQKKKKKKKKKRTRRLRGSSSLATTTTTTTTTTEREKIPLLPLVCPRPRALHLRTKKNSNETRDQKAKEKRNETTTRTRQKRTKRTLLLLFCCCCCFSLANSVRAFRRARLFLRKKSEEGRALFFPKGHTKKKKRAKNPKKKQDFCQQRTGDRSVFSRRASHTLNTLQQQQTNDDKKRPWWFSRLKKFHFCLKKILIEGQKYAREKKGTKIKGLRLAHNLHRKDTLSVLETDSKPASMPRREYQSSCVCVYSPREGPRREY